MADRAQPVTAWPGLAAAALVAALLLAAVAAVALRAETASGLAPQDWAAIRFTIWQAALSAALSTAAAIPVARALARRSFKGRAALITEQRAAKLKRAPAITIPKDELPLLRADIALARASMQSERPVAPDDPYVRSGFTPNLARVQKGRNR